MEHAEIDPTDRCVNGRCWVGPMLVIGTQQGAIGELRTAIKVMLSKFHNKPTTLAMMACLTTVHVSEERTILAFAIGREPHATVLRHIYMLVRIHYGGVLRAHCADYHFGIEGADERDFCDQLIAHEQWLQRITSASATRSYPLVTK